MQFSAFDLEKITISHLAKVSFRAGLELIDFVAEEYTDDGNATVSNLRVFKGNLCVQSFP